MLKLWTANKKDKQEEEEFKQRLRECSDVLDRLQEICKQKQESSTSQMRDKTKFSNSAWTHEMANQLGYQRALEELVQLLEIRND